MFNYERNLVFWQLLLYGVHVGHRFKNSSLYAGWLVFTYTYETLIINLYKTLLGFKNGNVGYDFCCRVGSPIWFLNLNKAFEIYVSESALKCGEFAYCTYWIHGMISNWIYLADQIDQLWHYTEDAHKGQFAKLEMDYSPWFMSRWSWPRAVLISSVHTSEWPSHECLISKIPSVGIVDTNISGHISNIATPGNDDSLESMIFYNTNTSLYILEKKYMHITGWLHHIRETRRNVSFSDWILRHFIKKNGKLNKKKIYNIINQREKKEQITDFMQFFITYKINSTKLWGLGVKFFFGLGSGENEFQGGLDLYSQNNEKINSRFDIYKLLEEFKKRGFVICKFLNFYLLKGLWHSSSSVLIRKKYMSKKWFKFRFLTCVYYEQVWIDDYYKTNFLVNRFWRNRVFKTYLRRSFFRNNIFLLKFFKFYNNYRYQQKRGFMDAFSGSFLKVSSFSCVAQSYGFNYFKRHFYTPMLKVNNDFNNLFNIKKFGFLSRWILFKKEMGSFLNNIIFGKKYSENYKYVNLYKNYAIIKEKNKNFIYLAYSYLNFYYSFWYFNRNEYRFIKMTKKWHLTKKFRALKNLNKLTYYLELFKKSIFPFIRFKRWFLKEDLDLTPKNLLNKSLARIFGLLSLNYRKKFFNYFLNYKSFKIRKLKRYFKKLLKKNKYKRRRNLVISTLNYKYKRFKRTKEVQDKVRKLYKKITKNILVEYYNRKYNRVLSNKLSLKQFVSLTHDKRIRRMTRYDNIQYNVIGFDFFQTTKLIYNKPKLFEWTPKIQLINEDIWFIEDDEDKKLPSTFLKIFSKSKNPTYCNILKHNLCYFNQVVINTTFYNMFLKLKRLRKSKKFNILKVIQKSKMYKIIKKNHFIKTKGVKFLKTLRYLKFKYKRHVKRIGNKQNKLVSGHKFFNSLIFVRLWSMIKKDYMLNKGYYFLTWNINFNKNNLFVYKGLTKPLYLLKNNGFVYNFTYIFYVRFYNIYNRFINQFSNQFINKLMINKHHISKYYRGKFKAFWY